jgi:hypothetical protein
MESRGIPLKPKPGLNGAPSRLLLSRLFKSNGRAFPGFPFELIGFGELHAAFLTESRTREPVWSLVQEIRVARFFRPMYA